MKLDIHSNGIKFDNIKTFGDSQKIDVFGDQELEGEIDLNDFLDESGNVNLTQEQVDELIQEFSDSVNHLAKTSCQHSWKEYVGLISRYNYCVHCNIKE